MRPTPLNPDQLRLLGVELPQWSRNAAGDTLSRTFRFEDFASAFAFMTQVALAAERNDHHPHWSNDYRDVHISWTTHDVRALTERDVKMARICEAVFGESQVKKDAA